MAIRGFSVFVLLAFCDFDLDSAAITHGNDKNGVFCTIRRKRGSLIGFKVFQGKYAANTLLKGARPIPSDRMFSRHFEKKGNYQQALKDFASMRPANVEDYILPGSIKGKRGQVGDLTILVENGGERRNAMMKLFHKLQDPDKSRLDEIIYKVDN